MTMLISFLMLDESSGFRFVIVAENLAEATEYLPQNVDIANIKVERREVIETESKGLYVLQG